MNAEDKPRHVPGTRADEHESDFDYAKERQDLVLDLHVSFEPLLQRMFRAGWDAHKEEMIQQAMEVDR